MTKYQEYQAYFEGVIPNLERRYRETNSEYSRDKIEEYIQAALMIEPKGIYYYFWAYIKYDHFYRKSYITSPNYQEVLEMAKKVGLSNNDVEQLYEILGVEHPSCL